MECKHERGDYVLGYWLCADCFAKIDRRPVEYRMVSSSEICVRGADGKVSSALLAPRQEIAWQSKIAKSPEGVIFSKFIMMIAERFVQKGKIDKETAVGLAIEAIKSLAELGDKFGDPDFAWDKDAAIEIADEEMSYWDSDEAVGNS
jgi:hypothetical protein